MFNTMDNTMDTKLHNGCSYRLPCGYCILLGRDCPRQAAVTANFTSNSDSTAKSTSGKLEG